MKLFEKLDSAKLGKRLQDLSAQLSAADAAIAEKQEALEVALAEDRPSEKPLNDLALARTRAEALRSVIAKGENELIEAQEREEKERQRKAADAMAVRFGRLRVDLEGRRQKIRAAAKALKEAEEAFDSATGELREIIAATGLSQAVGSLVPRGAALKAGGNAIANGDSDLNSIYTRIAMAIRGAQAQVMKEAVA